MSATGLYTTHVIFDLDGLLLNTEDIYTQVFDEMAMRYAHTHFTSEAKRLIQGRRLSEGELIFKELYGVPNEKSEIDKAAHAILNELLPGADFMPGAEKLVKHLYEHHIPMSIATGSDAEGFRIKTQKNREFFDKYFDHVVLSTDPAVKHGKPAPDIFLAAGARFKTQPQTKRGFLVFDDAYLGIKGALAAEMPCVWVPSIPDMDTTLLPATMVLKSLEEFEPEMFGMPPYPVKTLEEEKAEKEAAAKKRGSLSPPVSGRVQ